MHIPIYIFQRSIAVPLGLVRIILLVRSGLEEPQFNRSDHTLVPLVCKLVHRGISNQAGKNLLSLNIVVPKVGD